MLYDGVMPARSSAPPRERDYDFSNVGKVGRRTGVTLAPRALDKHGLEEMSGLFSSPRKPSPVSKQIIMESVEEDMQQTPRATGQHAHPETPGTATSIRRSHRGVPRSASPRKSGITGSARRSGTADVLAQKQLQQETEDAVEESIQAEEQTVLPAATPVQAVNPKAVSAKAATVRRFSPDRTPLRNRVLNRQSKSAFVGRVSDVQPTSQEATVEITQEETPSRIQTTHVIPDELPEDEGIDMMGAQDEEVAEPEIPDSEQAEPVVSESDHEEEPELPLPPVLDDEEEDQNFEPVEKTTTRRRQPNKANSRRKRKSDAMEEAEEAAAISSPAAKRAKRKSTEHEKSNRQEELAPQPSPKEKAPARKALATKNTNSKMSKRQQKELDDVVEKIRARPGQNKSLYVLRRETPADDNVARTRSGRVSIKPLAWWRNEGIVYDAGDGSRGLADDAVFPMNSIKEIIRHEEHYSPARNANRKGKQKRGKRRARSQEADESDLDLDGDNDAIDPDADDWELDTGTLKGQISVWDPDQGAPVDEDEAEIAYAAAAIETKEVKGSTFRYAKLVSTPFSGTGVVDLPAGGVKKTKNSRKMHMCFFVAQGRVTVEVGPVNAEQTRFSIGKGGFWQVPRGKSLL